MATPNFLDLNSTSKKAHLENPPPTSLDKGSWQGCVRGPEAGNSMDEPRMSQFQYATQVEGNDRIVAVQKPDITDGEQFHEEIMKQDIPCSTMRTAPEQTGSIRVHVDGTIDIEVGNHQPADYHPVHNKTDTFRLWSFSRPHNRGFHYAWWTCFTCFFAWFSISPLLSTLEKPPCADLGSPLCVSCLGPNATLNATAAAKDKHCRVCFPADQDYGCGGLGITPDQIFSSNAIGVAGTLILRLMGGPLMDYFGARNFQIWLMIFSIWGLYWLAFVKSYEELVAARFFISFLGASFVATSAWCSVFFDKSIIGLVGATATGWGKVGAGVAYLVIPLIFRSLKVVHGTQKALSYTLLVPPSIIIVTIVCTYFFSDSSPDTEKFLKEKNQKEKDAINQHSPNKLSILESFKISALNYRTYVMGALFFFSNGVDLTMGAVVAYYFVKEFHMHQSDASLAGSVFGLMNLFARSLGGLFSDKLSIRMGLFGRVIATFICTLSMGISLVVFASIDNNNGGLMIAVIVLMISAVFTHAAQGACYGIVPTIEPAAVGAVAGVVGAWGNLGSISMNLLMRIGFRQAWTIIGYGCILVSFTVFFVALPDEEKSKKLKESLQKHGRRLISWRSGPEGDDKTLRGLVVLLLEKEKDLKTLHETIATKDAEISGLRAMMQHAALPLFGSVDIPVKQDCPSPSEPTQSMRQGCTFRRSTSSNRPSQSGNAVLPLPLPLEEHPSLEIPYLHNSRRFPASA